MKFWTFAVFSVILTVCQCLTTIDDGELPAEHREADSDYYQIGLDLHNLFRAKHGVLPLKLNDTLNRAAQSYADYLIQTNSFKNKLEPGFLKNLYYYKGEPDIEPNQAVENAVRKWYGSMRKYNWNRPDVTAFSALVWKSTTDLGIGVSTKGHRTVVVAAYSPAGNLLGDDGQHFRENVFRADQ